MEVKEFFLRSSTHKTRRKRWKKKKKYRRNEEKERKERVKNVWRYEPIHEVEFNLMYMLQYRFKSINCITSFSCWWMAKEKWKRERESWRQRVDLNCLLYSFCTQTMHCATMEFTKWKASNTRKYALPCEKIQKTQLFSLDWTTHTHIASLNESVGCSSIKKKKNEGIVALCVITHDNRFYRSASWVETKRGSEKLSAQHILLRDFKIVVFIGSPVDIYMKKKEK